MPEKILFEYAVIRVVPKVEREEFLNVGIILYCPQQQILQTKIGVDEARLKAFSPELNIEEVKSNLSSFEQISLGGKDSGPIGKLDTASRFRWLTATRSTIIQVSKIHPGFCFNVQETIDKLFRELVLNESDLKV